MPGKLLIIGGAEDKKGDCEILKTFVELAGGVKACIVIITAATKHPIETGKNYQRIFSRLGVKNIEILELEDREGANSSDACELIYEATGIFFTGGDQLRITCALGGTKIEEAIKDTFNKTELVIAGTSAGASVMSSTMILEGDSDQSPKLATVKMAPGMGFFPESVVDQHFAQRGRIGRLITAIAHNPGLLGLGIDEDTAIIVNPHESFTVIGSQTVTVLDGRQMGTTNISELSPQDALAITNVILHILPAGYQYNMQNYTPTKRESL